MQAGKWTRRDFIAAGMAVAGGSAWAASATPVILVVGDSLSAEYGLRRGTGWVPLLEKRLAQQKIAARVVNASISGDTTSGGRSRLPGLLRQHQPSHVVIELGGNDALRGLPIAMTDDNLSQMVDLSRKAGARVLVVGMQLPPNYGSEYTTRFADMYATIARRHQAGLVPFLLAGVADGPDAERLFQSDRIHPREEAQPRMLDNVWPELRKLLATPAPTAAGARNAKPATAPRS